VIGWIWEKAGLSALCGSLCTGSWTWNRTFFQEFAFDNKTLKTFVEFRICWNVRSSFVQTSSHLYNLVQSTFWLPCLIITYLLLTLYIVSSSESDRKRALTGANRIEFNWNHFPHRTSLPVTDMTSHNDCNACPDSPDVGAPRVTVHLLKRQ